MKERIILKITLGFIVVMLLGMSTFLTTALVTDKNPVDFISSIRVGDNTKLSESEEVDVNKVDKLTDVKIDAGNGKVLLIEGDNNEADQDKDGEDDKTEDQSEDMPITGNALEQASAVALNYIGEGRVTDTEIDDEEGYYEIEITLDNGREVDVHLDKNFKVISQESESDNEDDDE